MIKHPTIALRIVMFVFMQTITLLAYSQDERSVADSVRTTEPVAIHTYTESKSFEQKKDEEHNSALAFVPVIWETLWFRLAMGMLVIALLLFIQRLRMRTIQKIRRAHEKELGIKNDEILAQEKNMKLQLGSLRNLQDQNETLRKELVIQIARANNAEMAKSSFLAMVSYGVRAPLNRLGEASALLSLTSLSSEQEEYNDTIRAASENLVTAVSDIFDFAKIESGQIKLEEKEFNLRRSIEEVMDTFTAKISETDVDLVYRISPEVPAAIVGDNFRLKQVLVSMVANVLKFSPEVEDILINVRSVRAEGSQHALCFEIHNSGTGINYDSAVNMFKSFSQTDFTETEGGTGLGLANCENLVRLMGGTITMENHRGKGSSFSFMINVRPAKNTVLSSEMFDTETLERKKVLLVHNHQNSLVILKHQLEQWKMNVTTASSGFAAMKILSENSGFDIVITDFKMQGFDGVQLAQAIRRLHATLPVILLSSAANPQESNLFSSVLAKPVKQSALFKHVQKGVQTFERIDS